MSLSWMPGAPIWPLAGTRPGWGRACRILRESMQPAAGIHRQSGWRRGGLGRIRHYQSDDRKSAGQDVFCRASGRFVRGLRRLQEPRRRLRSAQALSNYVLAARSEAHSFDARWARDRSSAALMNARLRSASSTWGCACTGGSLVRLSGASIVFLGVLGTLRLSRLLL